MCTAFVRRGEDVISGFNMDIVDRRLDLIYEGRRRWRNLDILN